eukprot:TRINITY_DN4646_c0_g1_i2.p1 TRINITY_DN4646_c0_g1~~TRINITY_DN4646_c0_g1_i2.p1  ORF type:complete len:911 (+),score=213.98 TRINITY_DN4646_c0_g1_i2:65-2797(+)
MASGRATPEWAAESQQPPATPVPALRQLSLISSGTATGSPRSASPRGNRSPRRQELERNIRAVAASFSELHDLNSSARGCSTQSGDSSPRYSARISVSPSAARSFRHAVGLYQDVDESCQGRDMLYDLAAGSGLVLGWPLDVLVRLRDNFYETAREGMVDGEGLAKVLLTTFDTADPTKVARLALQICMEHDVEDNTGLVWFELFCYLIGIDPDIDADGIQREFASRECTAPALWRETLWAVMEHAAGECYRHSGPKWLLVTSWWVAVLSQLVIAISTLTIIIESLYLWQPEGSSDATFAVETICIAFFTVEFFLRLACCPLRRDECHGPMMTQRDYWTSPWTWIDVVAIFPYYASISGADTLAVFAVFRLVRLTRAVRVLKLGRHSEEIQVMAVALHRARYALFWMVIFIAFAVLLFSALAFHCERDEARFNHTLNRWVRSENSSYVDAGKVIDFQSIPDAMWWVLVTVCTVGYGDMTPVTHLGKLSASVAMVSGIILIAYPATMMTGVFAEVREEYESRKRRQRQRESLRKTLLPAVPHRRPSEDKLAGTATALVAVARLTKRADGSPGRRVQNATPPPPPPPPPQGAAPTPAEVLLAVRAAQPQNSPTSGWYGPLVESVNVSGAVGPLTYDMYGSMARRPVRGVQLEAEAGQEAAPQADPEPVLPPQEHLRQIRAAVIQLGEAMEKLVQRQTQFAASFESSYRQLVAEQHDMRTGLLRHLASSREELLQTYRDCYQPEGVRLQHEMRQLRQRLRDMVSALHAEEDGQDLERRLEELRGREDELPLLRDFEHKLLKRARTAQRKEKMQVRRLANPNFMPPKDENPDGPAETPSDAAGEQTDGVAEEGAERASAEGDAEAPEGGETEEEQESGSAALDGLVVPLPDAAGPSVPTAPSAPTAPTAPSAPD